MGRTLIRFRIMPPLYGLNHATIAVPTPRGDVEIGFKIVVSGLSPFKASGEVKVIGDDLGTLHNTIIEVRFPAFVEVGMPSTPSGFNEAQTVSVDLLNLVLGHYRRVANMPQIRAVAVKHAAGYEFEEVDDEGKARVGSAFGRMGLTPNGEDAGLADGPSEIVQAIQAGVSQGRLPLWYTLYLDAIAEHSSANYRSALAHIYMSFEMLATMTCRVLGSTKVGGDAVTAFLEPSGDDEPHPSIYQIVGQTRAWFGEGPSKSQLKDHLGRLWKHRNDVMHGSVFEITRADFRQALDAFAFLGPWYQAIGRKLSESVDLSEEELPQDGIH